jgi:uncharacterized repeat protein (TIGR03806 family)
MLGIRPIKPTKSAISLLSFGLLLLLVLGLQECKPKPKGVILHLEDVPYEHLSDYQFFKGDIKLLQANDSVIPYDLITPLFSDYAQKARFFYVPSGKSIVYNDTDVLDFPLGSAIIKNFYYANDLRDSSKGRRLMETRVLIHKASGWEAYPYVWNEEQTDAELKVAGASLRAKWIDKAGEAHDIEYNVPNKNQCKGCHWNHEAMTPIGPKVRNLNHKFHYANAYRNQLDMWSSLGLLKGLSCPGVAPKVAQWDDTSANLQDRALAYLDVNCGHCHRAEGPAATSGLILQTTVTDPVKLGVMKVPVAAGIGSGGRLYDIVPGKPDSSIIYFRMNSVHPGIMMPELGRHLIHKEGVALIRAWIAQMDKDHPITTE